MVAPRSAVPEMVIVGGGVEPRLATLASVLCRRRAVSFDELLSRKNAPRECGAALVLWSPGRVALGFVVAVLEALSRWRVRFGLIPCDDPDIARWFLVKTLSFPEVRDRGRMGVVSGTLDGHGRPACVRLPEQPASDLLRSDLDLLVIDGHGNALDLDLGTKTVLCARAAAPSAGGDGLFPCFNDGRCFRQVGARAGAELVDPSAVGSLLLVMLTCNLLHLGWTSFTPRAGIVPALMGGGVVTAIVTAGATPPADSLTVVALSLIHEGYGLGEVAEMLNEHQAVHQDVATGLPRGIGPFVVLGNPCTRLVGTGVAQARVVHRHAGSVTAELHRDWRSSPRGSFVRVPITPAELRVPSWTLRGLAGDAWGRVAVVGSRHNRAAYLWLGPQVRIANRTLQLDADTSAGFEERRTLESCVERLRIWPVVLDSYLEDHSQAGAPAAASAAAIERSVLGLIRLQRTLAQLVNRMESAHRLTTSDDGHRRRFEMGLGHLRQTGAELLRVCVGIATSKGLPDLGDRSSMRFYGNRGEVGPCACGESLVYCHSYASLESDDLRLLRYICACGDAGQDSAGTAIQLRPAARRARRDQTVRLRLQCTAPQDHFLFVQGLAAVDQWFQDRPIHGNVSEALVSPGASADVECDVHIPPRLSSGIYPISVVGVANGGLVHRRTMFQIDG